MVEKDFLEKSYPNQTLRVRGWVILIDRHCIHQTRSSNGSFLVIARVGHSD